MRREQTSPLLLLLTSAIAACSGHPDDDPASDAAPDAGKHPAPGSDASVDAGVQTRDAALEGGGGTSEFEFIDASTFEAGSTEASTAPDAGEQDACSWEPLDGSCEAVSLRRPFLVGTSMRSAVSVTRADWLPRVRAASTDIDSPTRELLAEIWRKDALEEHASIAAFARLTLQLLALGAPAELVASAQRASLDEVRHARDCFGLASRYSGRVLGPSALSLDDALQPATYAELARLCVEEGCVGETLGALLAREQLAIVEEPAVRSVLQRLARDEARHAQLSWSVARWTLLRGGEHARQAARSGFEHAIGALASIPVRTYDGIDAATFRAHGRLTCSESRAVAERGIVEVIRPAMELLFARSEEVSSLMHGSDPSARRAASRGPGSLATVVPS